MAEKSLSRLARLLGIVTYLEAHGEAPFAELADHFGVTADQIRADVNTLWVSGLPGRLHNDLIDFDYGAFEQDIAHLTNAQGVTQVRLSAREAVALLGALSTLLAAGTAPAAAESALAKLRTAVGGPEPVTVVPASTTPAEVSHALIDAVARRRITRVTYVDAHDRRTERVIEPHRIVTIDGVGYVECFCRRADDYRTLRLDRITMAIVTDDSVTMPPSDATGFSLAPRFEATVVVARSGRWVCDDMPGVVIAEAGEDLVATFPVADADWAAARLMAVAPWLRSVEPAELRERLAVLAGAVIDAHAE